jgi:hypothetical protein
MLRLRYKKGKGTLFVISGFFDYFIYFRRHLNFKQKIVLISDIRLLD